MSTGSATSMYLIFISRGKSISSLTSQSLLTSTDESRGFSWASGRKEDMLTNVDSSKKYQVLFLAFNEQYIWLKRTANLNVLSSLFCFKVVIDNNKITELKKEPDITWDFWSHFWRTPNCFWNFFWSRIRSLKTHWVQLQTQSKCIHSTSVRRWFLTSPSA